MELLTDPWEIMSEGPHKVMKKDQREIYSIVQSLLSKSNHIKEKRVDDWSKWEFLNFL